MVCNTAPMASRLMIRIFVPIGFLFTHSSLVQSIRNAICWTENTIDDPSLETAQLFVI